MTADLMPINNSSAHAELFSIDMLPVCAQAKPALVEASPF
jgi:hypothetical protein